MTKDSYDAIVVGSGPNGLAAAITMQKAGLEVLLIEAKETIGGGLRSAQFMDSGNIYDICSAIHPMALQSPFFKRLPLEQHGLTYINPPIMAAHPLDGGKAVGLFSSLEQTSGQFNTDKNAYIHLFKPLTKLWPTLISDLLAPFHIPSNPFPLIRFGKNALLSATQLAKRFQTEELKALWAGMAAHSMLPLDYMTTSAVALVLSIAGHTGGWPIPRGGSQQIANALASYFKSIGGDIETSFYVDSLKKLPTARAFLFDLGPKQLIQIAGDRFHASYRRQLGRYRYGMGVFKIDWLLDGPIPFQSEQCRKAGTVHLGNSLQEIAHAERQVWEGKHPERPFVLLAQQSLFDTTRVMGNHQIAWAYCHVPNGSTVDMTMAIEQQVERYAPGFKDQIIAKQCMNTHAYEIYNPNYIGGDINGGVMDLKQLYTRPALRWSPYGTPAKDIYICSSSTPPGGGVHGMCGYHAAKQALKKRFGIEVDF
ncbi:MULTISPECIES: phytoene desaturase family protein [Olivibacter]|jgi:phytoene dehydrogenase-like protein|uniref:Phytoene desaturase family protein n=1 Tax=Olivibacter oleidegradans TaxID=760123 RepID=A0ABV6HSR5_9SPHI|nr:MULTISPECIES: NAD(P)/FAD-dependent oxidoreductase [Olivibacter]QEL04047.1 NAD(P)/FAD-dependent oxidoreductase [Olivibacter sp. LS-1]